MIGTHVKAIHRARVYAERAEDAFTVIYLEAIDAEAFAKRVLFLVDVDAIDRAGPNTLITGNAGGEIEPMKATIARSYRHRLFRVFELPGERLSTVGAEKSPGGGSHSRQYSDNRLPDVVKPVEHNDILEVSRK